MGSSDKLLQEAARLRRLAEECEDLAARAPLSGADRAELRTAARGCRQLAAELEAAAEKEA